MILFLTVAIAQTASTVAEADSTETLNYSIELAKVIREIQPNLTFGGVFLALFFITFRVGKFFWDKEDAIRGSSLATLRQVLGHFKDSIIRPTLENKTKEWVEAAYKETIELIERKIKNDESEFRSIDEIKNIFTTYEKKELLGELSANDKIGEFYSSRDGVRLLDKLDQQYLNSRDFKKTYDVMIFCCKSLAYLCFLLSLIFLSSLLHLVWGFHLMLAYFYIYTVVLLIVLILFFFLRFEFYRYKNSKTVEHYNMTGDISV